MGCNTEGNVSGSPAAYAPRGGPTEIVSTRISERKAALLEVLRVDFADRWGEREFKTTKGRIIEYAVDRLLHEEGLIEQSEIR